LGSRFDIKTFFKDIIALDADEDIGNAEVTFSDKFEVPFFPKLSPSPF
jgi:hypothetical protein